MPALGAARLTMVRLVQRHHEREVHMAKKAFTKATGLDIELIEATVASDLEAVQALLARGANPCAIDDREEGHGRNQDEGIAAIHAAFLRGVSTEVSQCFLALPKVDWSTRTLDGRTALHVLFERNVGPDRVALATALLDRGVSPNTHDARGRSPLYQLTKFWESRDELELIELLLARGADLAYRNDSKQTVVDLISRDIEYFPKHNDKKGLLRVYSLLLDKGAPAKDAQSLENVRAIVAHYGPKLLKPKASPRAKKVSASKSA